MQNITTSIELKSAIKILKIRQKDEGLKLKAQLKITFDSLKPVSLIKSTITDLVSDSEIQGKFIGKAIGLSAGYLSKRLLMGAGINPLLSIAGTILQIGLSRYVANNGNEIKEKGISFIKTFFNKKNTKYEK